MKITDILYDYKTIVKHMKREATIYNRLNHAVRQQGCSRETYEAYRNSWLRLVKMNEEAYWVMHDYRRLAVTLRYRLMFALHILPKQNGLHYIDESKCRYTYTNVLNCLNLD